MNEVRKFDLHSIYLVAELEEQCEELEQVRGKLNTEIMELKQNIRNEKDTFNKKV